MKGGSRVFHKIICALLKNYIMLPLCKAPHQNYREHYLIDLINYNYGLPRVLFSVLTEPDAKSISVVILTNWSWMPWTTDRMQRMREAKQARKTTESNDKRR